MTEEGKTALLPGLLGIPDPDAPVYRIFGLWFFEEALRLRQLALLPPHRWEDPYEFLPSRVMMVDQRITPWIQVPLQPFLQPAYAQCWSRAEESDTLLRAYSQVSKDPHFNRNIYPRYEGVKVRSSPRKLLLAMQNWTETVPDVSCFVGAVGYGSGRDIKQHLANLIAQHGPRALGSGTLRAESLLLKRRAFAHESEVRIICVHGRPVPEQSLITIPINPSEVFDEVTFDPRLATFERKEREAVVQSLGYSGPFKESNLYQGVALEIVLPNGWK